MTEKYELLVKLGQGAFAQVYKARHKELGYIRAVRILNEFIKNEQDPSYIKFLKECKLLLRLGNGCNHNIVRVYQPCFSEHHAMVEMDFIDGDDIFHYIKKNGGFVPIKEIMKFLHDISSALAYCHEDVYKYCMNVVDDNLECDPDDASHFLIDDTKRQELINKYRVIHNDIHSGNIMRHRNGDYILLDFGIAIEGNEVARASCITNGAPEFKSPEKWEERDHLSTQSDIYSFGIILYEMLAGKVPFEYDQSNPKVWEAENQLRTAHLKETPQPVFNARKSAYEKAHPGKKYVQDYPDWLEKLVMKCLEKKPSDRFANGKELHNHYLAQLGCNDLLVNQEKEINALKEEVEALKKELINSAGNNAQKNQAANPLSNNSAAKLGKEVLKPKSNAKVSVNINNALNKKNKPSVGEQYIQNFMKSVNPSVNPDGIDTGNNTSNIKNPFRQDAKSDSDDTGKSNAVTPNKNAGNNVLLGCSLRILSILIIFSYFVYKIGTNSGNERTSRPMVAYNTNKSQPLITPAITNDSVVLKAMQFNKGKLDSLSRKLQEINQNSKSVNKISQSFKKIATRGTINGHEWVDLGLPSGILWATCNVDAKKPNDNGGYYAWGEVITKKEYKSTNCSTVGAKITSLSKKGKQDVAFTKWGSPWRIPTIDDFNELIDNCIWIWESNRGYKIISKKNGNSIFLPAGGWRIYTSLLFDELAGSYWTSTSNGEGAYALYFGDNSYKVSNFMRYNGHTIRPVCDR